MKKKSKASIALKAGADQVVTYQNFEEKVNELTDGKGVSIVFRFDRRGNGRKKKLTLV